MPPPRRKLSHRVATLSRWLHVYFSMAGLFVLLFFSATGVTLNHPGWFPAATRTSEAEGRVNPSWVATSGEVDRLAVVEHLRAAHRIHGALTSFNVDENECVIAFKGPAYSADAFLDRATGEYRLSQTADGVVAYLNDLHKGRDSGPFWSVVIDVSAVLLVLASLTGLVLLFYIKRRRISGLAVALVATVLVALVVALAVP